jgi:hypothetical protein
MLQNVRADAEALGQARCHKFGCLVHAGCEDVFGAPFRVLPQLQPGPAHPARAEVSAGEVQTDGCSQLNDLADHLDGLMLWLPARQCPALSLKPNWLAMLQASVSDGELKREAVTVSVVGRDMPFNIMDDEMLDNYIAALNVRLHELLRCLRDRILLLR